MPSVLNSTKYSLVLAMATIVCSAPSVAQGIPGLSADMGGQLIEFSGAMHATAEACGDYSAERLAGMKSEQQAMYAQQGLDSKSFNKAFDKGMADGKARWAGMSEAQRVTACKDIKQQMAEAGEHYSN